MLTPNSYFLCGDWVFGDDRAASEEKAFVGRMAEMSSALVAAYDIPRANAGFRGDGIIAGQPMEG